VFGVRLAGASVSLLPPTEPTDLLCAPDEAAGETLLAPFHASVRVGFRLEAG